MTAPRSLVELPAEARRHVEETKDEWTRLGDKRGRIIYFQTLNLDELNADEHSKVFSRLMSDAEAEFEANIRAGMPRVPAWVVDPIVIAALDGMHTGYDAFAALDAGGAG